MLVLCFPREWKGGVVFCEPVPHIIYLTVDRVVIDEDRKEKTRESTIIRYLV